MSVHNGGAFSRTSQTWIRNSDCWVVSIAFWERVGRESHHAIAVGWYAIEQDHATEFV